MADETVLIAAFSARALAQSARRAGYRPLVADAFGDLDTRAAAEDIRTVASAADGGFRAKPLIAALDELTSAAAQKPAGLVLGSGFEDKPRLIEALAQRYRLIGCRPETYRACKDPSRFFITLDHLDIAHPDVRRAPPEDWRGWLTKRVGGSGGRHIRFASAESRAVPRRYFQRRIDGDRLSVGGVFDRDGGTGRLSVTRQWISSSAHQPFRFGGCVSLMQIDDDVAGQLFDVASQVARAFNIAGMASFDFIVSDGAAQLLEVNPRPGASLDVLDDVAGQQFRQHVMAVDGTSPISAQPAATQSKALAILHADRAALTLGDVPWPDWAADRGAQGTFVSCGAPLASVLADAPTADAAEALAKARLAELEDLIYEHSKIRGNGA